MKYRNFKSVIGVFALLITNCLGTEVGNPPATDPEIKIDFVVQLDDADIGNILINADIEIEEAVIVVGSLRFRKCDLAEDQAFRSESFLAEPLRNEHTESSVTIKRGEYCRLDIEPLRGGKDGTFADRPELKGYTVYAKGTYKNNPLFIRYEGDDEISFFGGFSVETQTDRLFIAVDLAKWFEDVDLEMAEKNENEIILGDGNNGDLLEKLSKNFEASIQVAIDQNNDGVLDRVELRSED